jgi:uncharacterized protein DUF5916
MRLLLLLTVLASPPQEPPPQWRVRAGALGELRVDGVLDEAAWQTAEPIQSLTMIEPREGGVSAGRTEVRVLAGAKALAFGIRCDDPQPAGIVSFTKERDGDLESEDHVRIVLGPFQDGRSGYVFAVNPGGARVDALISPGGEDEDESWDGVWEAATRRDERGWSAEIRIPIETLKFRRSLREWHFNVERRIQRLQETSRWASPERDYPLTLTSRAGLLTELPDFDLGLGLSVRPALVGGLRRPQEPKTTADGDASLDVSQRLGSNTLASLTVNTDFAETEVDSRQTNLTRFPLFFPEKRAFFLEGTDIFGFGIGLGQDVVPFFSRRIGLVAGRQVPILAGLKTTGRTGKTSFGAVVTRTREETGLAPAATLASLRLKRDVLRESWIGFLGTAGDPLGRPDSWLAGVDLVYQTSRFRGDKNFLVGVSALAMDRQGLAGDKTAIVAKIDYPNDLWDNVFTYMRIGDGFDPSLGFVRRRNIHNYRGRLSYRPRHEDSWIRRRTHELDASLFTDLGGEWESWRIGVVPLELRLESGDGFAYGVTPTGERLVEPFEIEDDVVAPPGSYDFVRHRVEGELAAKRRFAGEVGWGWGSFYGGTLRQLDVEAVWTPSPSVTLAAEFERNMGRLPGGRFDQTQVGLRVRLNLSPDLQLNSFVQYDDQSREIGTNTRARWIFHPQGELFLIYNHNLRELHDRFVRDTNELLLKVQYTFRR